MRIQVSARLSLKNAFKDSRYMSLSKDNIKNIPLQQHANLWRQDDLMMTQKYLSFIMNGISNHLNIAYIHLRRREFLLLLDLLPPNCLAHFPKNFLYISINWKIISDQ